MTAKHSQHTSRHARRHAPRHSGVSGPVWFLAGACAVLALLSAITVVFNSSSTRGATAGSSRMVYVRGAGASTQAVTLRLRDAADTFVNFGARRKNYNTSDRLVASARAGDRKIAYLRFDLPRFASDELRSASLVLTRDMHHMAGVVHLTTVRQRDWQASRITAMDHPILGRSLHSVRTDRSMSSVSFNVIDQVRSNTSVSFGVTSSSRDNTVRFHSREAASGAPVLVLTLDEPVAPTPTPTPTTSSPAPTSTAPTTASSAPSTPASTSAAPTSSVPTSSVPTSTAPTSPSSTDSSGQLVRPTCAISAILVPACGRWWGVAPLAFMNTPVDQGIAQLESQTGQPFDVVHAYHRNTELFPNAAERAVALQPGHNRLLFLNWKPSTSKTWAAVANGAADATIDREAHYLTTTWRYPFFLTIWHEPENDVNATPGSGMTADDYAAMYRHVVERLRADGVNNAITVMTYMNYLPWEQQSWFNDLYPGDDVVDWIAVDSYASGAKTGYNSGDFDTMMNRSSKTFPGFYKWDTTMHGNKPLMIGEWGVLQDDNNPNGKADFYNSVGREIQNYPNIHALIYFDMPKPPKPEGNTSFDDPSSALSAFQALRVNPQVLAPQVVYGPNGSLVG